MEERVAQLIRDFKEYCDRFDASNLFTGPSLYFHLKTIKELGSAGSAKAAINDPIFLDYLYATLASWGMHRMGPGNAKLVELEDMAESLRDVKGEISGLSSGKIWDIQEGDLDKVASKLWNIISQLRVGIGATKIVAGSKTLHHILPELVPPIDREYTIKFFFGHKTLLQEEGIIFSQIYPYFFQIATSCRKEIEARLSTGMNTSITKVIDNAIVGFGIKHLKGKEQKESLSLKTPPPGRKLTAPRNHVEQSGHLQHSSERGRLADQIRDYVFKHYLEPARTQGKHILTIRAGDVHKEMGLSNRMPAVCSAISTEVFQEKYQVRLVKREGPSNSSNAFFTFEI